MEEKKEFEKFTISQVGLLFRDNKCLILKSSVRTDREYEFPGGRIDKGEDCETAFRRELKEELGFTEFESFGVVDYDTNYTLAGKATSCGIVQYIKNDTESIRLSKDHSEFVWITEDEIDDYSFIWKNAPRMLKKGFEFHRKLNK